MVRLPWSSARRGRPTERRARTLRRWLVAATVVASSVVLFPAVPQAGHSDCGDGPRHHHRRELTTAFVDLEPVPCDGGYWVLDADGGVFAFGDAEYLGSVPGLRAQGVPVAPAQTVAMAPTSSGQGYWVLDGAGGVFAFGDAEFLGSVPGLRAQGVPIAASQIVAMAPTSSGRGYWVLDAAGGVFAFGDARFHGSVPELRAQGVPIAPSRVVALTPTPSGRGYWVLDAAGGVFSFGDAQFHGSVPQLRAQGVAVPPSAIVAMASTSSGRGYWVLDAAGGVFAFGDADFHGSAPGGGGYPAYPGVPATEITPTSSGDGYWVLFSAGVVRAFGDAGDYGSHAGSAFVPRLGMTLADGVTIQSPPYSQMVADDLLARLNAERRARGLAPVREDATLGGAARQWSLVMEGRGQGHGGLAFVPAGSFAYLGEMVFGIPPALATGEYAHVGYMRSDPHRRHMLDPGFDTVGIGVVCGGDGSMWTTTIFGRTHGSSRPAAGQSGPGPVDPITAGHSSPAQC